MGTERSAEGSKGIVIPTGDRKDDRAFIGLHAIECIDCGEHTNITEDEETVYNWQLNHYNETGHRNSWHYKIERGRGRLIHPSKGEW
jgi:hypothetical protein